MKKLLLIILIISPIITYGQELNVIQMPDGSSCYDQDSQLILNEALSNGVECINTLTLCRQWRDKYRSQLKKSCTGIKDYEPVYITSDKWTKKTWFKVIGIGLLSFTTGSIIL